MPEEAIVDIRIAGPPPGKVTMGVKVEVAAPVDKAAELRTWAAPPMKTEGKPPPKPKPKATTGPAAKEPAGKVETATSGAGPAKDAAGGDDSK